MKLYRVKDVRNNTYMAGGTTLKFTKKGKYWSTKGHLKNNLLDIHKDDKRKGTELFRGNMNNWVVEEYDVIPSQTMDLLDFVTDDDPKLQYQILSFDNK